MRPRNDTIQRPRNARATLRRLAAYLLRCAPLLALAIALSLAGNLLALIAPTLCGHAIDAIAAPDGHVDFPAVSRFAALMAACHLAAALLAYVVTQLVLRISQRTVRTMRAELFDKLMRLPIGYHDTHPTGDLLSRISYDIDTVNTSLSNDLVQLLTSAITVLGSLAMMLRLSPPLVAVFAVTVPLALLFTRFMARRVRPLFHLRSRCLGDMNAFIEEHVSGQRTLRAYGRQDDILARFERRNADAADSYYQAEYYASITGPSVNAINNLSLTLISVCGALMYLARAISLGDISSFVLYSRRFSGPINEAANILSELQSALAAAERIFTLLDEPEETPDPPDAAPLDVTAGDVDIAHLGFTYAPDTPPVLKDVSLHAPPGSMVAIVGPTGAGKTTLVNLLMRFYDPQTGDIAIDGQPIRHATRLSLRAAFSMVLQDTWLFSGSIHDNIAYGAPNASRQRVAEAAHAAHIDTMIEHLPNGYDTLVTEDGAAISKGQKQLLTIARAMLQPARLLILDEATSNVDLKTELAIQNAMRTLMRDKTCFVIAHRLSTIRHADIILVIRDGRIVEQGTHDQLMRRDGAYAALYRAQFE